MAIPTQVSWESFRNNWKFTMIVSSWMCGGGMIVFFWMCGGGICGNREPLKVLLLYLLSLGIATFSFWSLCYCYAVSMFFAYHPLLLNCSLPKGGHGIFNMHNNLSAFWAYGWRQDLHWFNECMKNFDVKELKSPFTLSQPWVKPTVSAYIALPAQLTDHWAVAQSMYNNIILVIVLVQDYQTLLD